MMSEPSKPVLRLLAIVSAATLSACAGLGPSGKPPEAPGVATPTAWQAPLPQNGPFASLGDWWQQFKDPALSQLIAAAQDVSPTVASAGARIAQSRASLVSSNAQLGPTLDASASASRARMDVNAATAYSLSAGLQSQWDLDLFGAGRAARDAAQARLAGTAPAWHEARISVAAEVAQQYTSLRACEAQLVQTGLDAQSRKETARLTELTARAGFQAPSNAALTRASAAQGNAQLLQQQAQCALGIKALVALTGIEEPALRQALQSGTAQLPQPVALALGGVPAQVLAQRPDLAVAARDVIAAGYDVNASDAQRYPRISLGGSIGVARFSSSALTMNGPTWSIGPLSISFPVIDGGVRRANLDAANARLQEARSVYAAKLRSAVREVEEALITLQNTADRTTDAEVAREGFSASFSAAQARFRGGLSSLFELEDARRSAVQAQSALIELQRERVAAWINLYRAVGGGWTQDSALASLPAAARQ